MVRQACTHSFTESTKRCTVGKPCSATCISRGDDCIIDLPPSAQTALRKVTKRLLNSGLAERDADALSEGLISLYNNSVTGKGKTGQSSYPPEIAKKYADYQKTGKRAVEPIKLTKGELDAIWESLDEKTKKDLKAKGKPPAGVSRDEERGKMILRKMVETGFRDEITGQPYSWRELQPDHERSLASYPASQRNKADRYSNIVLTHSGYNSYKGSVERQIASSRLREGEAEAFTKRKLEEEYGRQAKRSKEEFETEVREKLNAASARKERDRQLRENSELWSKDQWASSVAEMNGRDVKTLLSAAQEKTGVSGKFKVQNRSRGGEYYAPSLAVGKAVLLLSQGVPTSQWPPGLLKDATKSLRSDLKGRVKRGKREKEAGYEKAYSNRLRDFVGKVPPEFQAVLDQYS